MLLPLDRGSLRARNELDRRAALRRVRQRSPAERLRAQLELSELIRELRAVEPTPRGRRLALLEKSRLWIAPLRAIGKAPTRR
ncbi:MAG TPA: hypothetical protein VGP64_14765 [Polyangia bacterium]|jgi:hypothetical protein